MEGSGRDHLAAEAVRLYEATSPVFAAGERSDDDHFTQAVWVVRDIADRCAIFSKEWVADELRTWVNAPDRASVEESIRSTGLERWAEGLGYALTLRTSDVSPKLSVGRLWRLRTSGRRVADEFVAVAETYSQTQEIRQSHGPDWFKEHTSAMKKSAVFIAGARNNVLWAAVKDDGGAVVVAEATLLATQGMFVATHAPSGETTNFPTTEFLREFLHRKGGYQWLSKHRKDLPALLTPR
jgi:hypothetical protein